MIPIYNDIEEAYFKSLKHIIDHGAKVPIDRGSYEKELFRFQVPVITGEIKNPLLFSFLTNPNFPAVITGKAIDEYFKRYILGNGEHSDNEEYTYAERINASSQLEKCITMLSKGFTNQAAISISMPSDIDSADPPCLRVINFNCDIDSKGDKVLNAFVSFRSWDVFSAFPLNISGLAKLVNFVAGFTGFKTGSLIFCSSNCHIYSNCIDIAKLYIYR